MNNYSKHRCPLRHCAHCVCACVCVSNEPYLFHCDTCDQCWHSYCLYPPRLDLSHDDTFRCGPCVKLVGPPPQTRSQQEENAADGSSIVLEDAMHVDAGLDGDGDGDGDGPIDAVQIVGKQTPSIIIKPLSQPEHDGDEDGARSEP